MTKREMAERIEKLERTVDEWRRKTVDTAVRLAGVEGNVHRNHRMAFISRNWNPGVSRVSYATIDSVINAILGHLGLELKTEPATPERVVLVKKPKAGGKA